MFELRTFGLSILSQDVCSCKVCEYLSIAADKVPYENNVKFLCAIGRVACCIDGCLPLSYCKVCESVPVLSEGLSSKGVCISCLRCSDV